MSNCMSQDYPKWTNGHNTVLTGQVLAPNVVIAKLESTRLYGVQTIEAYKYSPFQGMTQLFWYEGVLKVSANIKGDIPPGSHRVLWACASKPCPYAPPRWVQDEFPLQIYFLRREGEWLRPNVDLSDIRYIAIKSAWDPNAKRSSVEWLADRFLLREEIVVEGWRSIPILDIATDASCALLGSKSCVARIKDLVKQADPEVKKYWCEYLEFEHKDSCPASIK